MNNIMLFCCDLQISEIFTLKYVPWGNAEVKQDHEIVCQHGPTECVMNTVQACALYYYPNMLAIINCIYICILSYYSHHGKKTTKKHNSTQHPLPHIALIHHLLKPT